MVTGSTMALTLTTATGLTAAAQCATVTGLAMAKAKQAKVKGKAKAISLQRSLARSATGFVISLSSVRPRTDHVRVVSPMLFVRKTNGAGPNLSV